MNETKHNMHTTIVQGYDYSGDSGDSSSSSSSSPSLTPNFPFGGHACACDHKLNTADTIGSTGRDKYKWAPSNCQFRKWNSKEFCNLLGKRTLLFLGDSTIVQAMSTLQNYISAGGGRCGAQIFVRRSDTLSYEELISALRLFTHGGESKKKRQLDVLILNAGAHFADTKEMNNMWENLNKFILKYREATPTNTTTFVWKTQNPGHPEYVDTPFTSYSAYKTHEAIPQKAGNYNYKLFESFDEISKTNAAKLGLPVIDMFPLYLRADAHPNSVGANSLGSLDRLHFCAPGPLDIIADILITMLYTKEI